MYVQLHRHLNVVLVSEIPYFSSSRFIMLHFLQIVEFKEKESSPCEIDFVFYLAVVKHSSIEDNPDDDSIEVEIPKVYLKLQSLIELDTFVVTHGPYTSVDGKVKLFVKK